MATTAAGTPYVESSDLVANYPGVSLALANHIDGLGKVLQVVQSTTTTAVTTTSGSYVTTGLTGTITPSSTSSKVLIMVHATFQSAGTGAYIRSTIFRGTVAGTNLASDNMQGYGNAASVVMGASVQFLDSPNTIAAQTYTYGFKTNGGLSGLFTVNSSTSTMTLMEISA